MSNITYNDLVKMVSNNLEISYKLLYISKFKVNGIDKVQVHCDKHDCQYSNLFNMDNLYGAVSKFMTLRAEYLVSEIKNRENIGGLYGVSTN
jgi:hypothetical protein